MDRHVGRQNKWNKEKDAPPMNDMVHAPASNMLLHLHNSGTTSIA